jgi:hypothetical protein
MRKFGFIFAGLIAMAAAWYFSTQSALKSNGIANTKETSSESQSVKTNSVADKISPRTVLQMDPSVRGTQSTFRERTTANAPQSLTVEFLNAKTYGEVAPLV